MNKSIVNKRVVVSLGKGNLQDGFPSVVIEVWELSRGRCLKVTANLPPAPAVANSYRDWQMLYKALSQRLHQRSGIEIVGSFLHVSEEDFASICDQLQQAMNQWLSAPSFYPAEVRLRTVLNPNDAIEVLIETEDEQIWRLPWNLWSLLDEYRHAEVLLSTQEFQQTTIPSQTPAGHIKILGILGNSMGIDLQGDRQLLEQLPGVVLEFLDEPERPELDRALWSAPHDILFFAGHSASSMADGEARIYINSRATANSLTIKQLKYALQQAIDRGLQLAVFNSCDGLGLAHQLAQLNLPNMIVMREDIPNRIAQEFLKLFLEEFANQTPIALAVRRAREKLQGWENEFPCASWLPVLWQNAVAPTLTWADLQGRPSHFPTIQPASNTIAPDQPLPLPSWFVQRRGWVVWAIGLAVMVGVSGIRHAGWLQSWELQAFDQLVRLRPDEESDPRILVIQVTQDDLNYQRQQGMRSGEGSLSDEALAMVLEKLAPHRPRTIGLDIYRDFPVSANQPKLKQALQNNRHLFTVCYGGDLTPSNPGVGPPPEVPPTQLGFSDVVVDEDKVLRRHLWIADFGKVSPCPADSALNLQLALNYLQQISKISIKWHPDLGQIHLTNQAKQHTVVLSAFSLPFGGYQHGDDLGYQMLLNYRSREPADSITLTQLLTTKSLDPDLITDRIILIGATTANQPLDIHSTPYQNLPATIGQGQEMYGVFVQASMVSQIISAVLDQRPLLRAWAWWGDGLWIAAWVITAGWIAQKLGQQIKLHSRSLWLIGAGIGVLGILYGSCWVLFIQGFWVPLIPTVIGVVIAGGSVYVLTLHRLKSYSNKKYNC